MAKEMLINVSEGEECRIALLQDNRLDELYMERTSSTSHVGNIYKGRVTNVEASIQAAFIDFGLGRNGFLHISDLMPTYFGRRGEEIHETVGRKMARRDRPPIQRCLRRGDEIVVQIIKEGIGTKGPTLSTYLSIPGRILVMMPGVGKMGVSRKIEDDDERRRLRQILDSLEPLKDVGFIIRTAGVGKSKTEIQRDLTYLTRLWQTFVKKRDSGPPPMELYTEGDLVTRTVRDVFTSEVDRIVVDNKDVAKRVKDVIKLANPRAKNKVDLYEDPVPLFHRYGIEKEIELMYSRHVPLPSGGSLVIDSTEAIVAIDVNSGKFRDHSDAEMTAFKTDLEAADEIPRQLRLRDLGGVIICDFIDLRYERHRRELDKRIHDNLRNDRAKTKVLRMSEFGIVEMTRQRMRPSLKRSIYFDCPHCKGAGLVKTPESMSLDVMRRLAIAISDQRVQRVELAVCPDVSFYLQNKKRLQLAALEDNAGKRVIIRADAGLGLDEMTLELFDQRDGLVIIDELSAVMTPQPHTTQLGTRPPGQAPAVRGGRFDTRQRGAPPRRPPAPSDEDAADDRFELDNAEQAVEEREEGEAGGDFDNSGAGDQATLPAGPMADTEAASEGVENLSYDDGPARQRPPGGPGSAASGPNEQGEPGTGRRRRRRRGGRGRRGRGRGGAGVDGGQQPIGQPGSPNGNLAREDEDDAARDDEANGNRAAEPEAFEQDAEADAEEVLEETVIELDVERDVIREDDRNPEDDAGADSRTLDDQGEDAPAAEGPREGKPPEGEEGPRRRRRRRGGRGRRRSKAGDAAGTDVGTDVGAPSNEAEPEDARAGTSEPAETAEEPVAKSPPARAARPERKSPASRVAEELPVTRTGSTDRHLISDEPVLPEPLPRPRSYRDLDHIPDDID